MEPYTTRTRPSAFNRFGRKFSRISWGAIFAGGLTALIIVTMLNLLGLGIGLTTIDPMTEAQPLSGLGTGSIIWFVVSNLIALFIGGWVAARMAGYPAKTDGSLHGFLAWGLFAFISLYLVSSAVGSVFNGMSSAVSGIFGGSNQQRVTVMLDKAQQNSQNQTDLSFDKIKREAFQLINQAERYDILPEDASENARDFLRDSRAEARQAWNALDVDRNIDAFFNDLNYDLDENGNLDISVAGNRDYFDREEIKDYLVANSSMSEAEINGLIQKWNTRAEEAVNQAEAYYAEARQKAVEYSDKAADAAGKAAIGTFFVFLSGAIASLFGGMAGAPKHTLEEDQLARREEEIHTAGTV